MNVLGGLVLIALGFMAGVILTDTIRAAIEDWQSAQETAIDLGDLLGPESNAERDFALWEAQLKG